MGSNGAGKTRFMQEMMHLCEGNTFRLNAIGADLPELSEDLSPGSVDTQYRQAAQQQPYMRTDAVSQIDKLIYMLFIDEFRQLISTKHDTCQGKKTHPVETRLDKLRQLWEKIFPGNRIVTDGGRLLFATNAGDDLIDAPSLSQGEKTIFYHIAAILYAAPGAVVFVESPSLFIHRAILHTVWNSIEQLRPDCTFVYDSVDEDFVGSRSENTCIWIKRYDSDLHAWEYEIMASGQYTDDLFIDLIGSRKPVLFIEGDASHSLDMRLYSLVFTEYTPRPVGSCEKVIETTRSFNDQRQMHHLDSSGIVDRDRRTDAEVEYLRKKNIMVPEVAEIENIFLLEDVIKIMAANRGKDSRKVFEKVKKEVFRLWKAHYPQQALQHVRHKVKREVECKIDARFSCITAMETHLLTLIDKLRPRDSYEALLREFADMITNGDYAGILRVFNHKPMLGDSGVARLLGYSSKDAYIAGVMATIKGGGKASKALRQTIKYALRAPDLQ